MRRGQRLAALGVGCCLTLLAGTSDSRAGEGPGSAQAGARVAANKGCGQCHALPGDTSSGKKPGPPFVAPASAQPASEVLRRLWNHLPAMWQHFDQRNLSWPEIRLQEMTHLFAFLGMRPGLERAPNLERGRTLLVQKGCLKCHTLAGEGGRLAPDLARFRQFGTPAPLATALWSHAPVMLARIGERGIPFPVFQEGEMGDLLAFLGAFVDVSR